MSDIKLSDLTLVGWLLVLVTGGIIFFVVSAAILKALGLPVVKRPPESELTRIL